MRLKPPLSKPDRPFKMRVPTPTEVQFHKTVAEFLDWALIPPATWTTFPAGGYLLAQASAQQLRARGLKPGMPDIQIFPGGGRCIMIELKVGDARLASVQGDMMDRLQRAGIQCFVCRTTLKSVIDVLNECKVPMREGIRIAA